MVLKNKREPDQDRIDSTTEPWEGQLRKGSLEMAILATLWKQRLYGLEILRKLESGSGLVMLEGTIYLILSRLKAAGLVEAEWVESSGHPRKYYRLTLGGEERLMRMVKFWSQFSAKLDQLIAQVHPGRVEGKDGKESSASGN